MSSGPPPFVSARVRFLSPYSACVFSVLKRVVFLLVRFLTTLLFLKLSRALCFHPRICQWEKSPRMPEKLKGTPVQKRIFGLLMGHKGLGDGKGRHQEFLDP